MDTAYIEALYDFSPRPLSHSWPGVPELHSAHVEARDDELHWLRRQFELSWPFRHEGERSWLRKLVRWQRRIVGKPSRHWHDAHVRARMLEAAEASNA